MALALKSGAFYDNDNPWNVIIIADDQDGNNYEILFNEVDQVAYTALTLDPPTNNSIFTDEYTDMLWALHTDNGFFNIEQHTLDHLRGNGAEGAKRVSVPFNVKVDTHHDHYDLADRLKVTFINDKTGGTAVYDASVFTEIIKDVVASATTTTAIVPSGSIVIPVPNGHTIEAGDVIKINYAGNIEYKYVKLADATNLVVKTPLEHDYAATSQIDRVGNTGIYQAVAICYAAGPHSAIITTPRENVLVSMDILSETEVEASMKADKIKEMLADAEKRQQHVFIGHA